MPAINAFQPTVAFRGKEQNIIEAGRKAVKQIQYNQLPKDVQREILIRETAPKINTPSNLLKNVKQAYSELMERIVSKLIKM